MRASARPQSVRLGWPGPGQGARHNSRRESVTASTSWRSAGLKWTRPCAPSRSSSFARADDDLAVEHHHQRVLVDLMLGQALARREGQQDDPVGLVVGVQDARRVRLHRSRRPGARSPRRDHRRRMGSVRCARLSRMELGPLRSLDGVPRDRRGERRRGGRAGPRAGLRHLLAGRLAAACRRPPAAGGRRCASSWPPGSSTSGPMTRRSWRASTPELRSEFGDRLLVGIGIGHPEATSDYTRPLATMRAFLDGIDAAPVPVPPDRRCLAALGPKMLDLCRERSRGTLTYFVATRAHPRGARPTGRRPAHRHRAGLRARHRCRVGARHRPPLRGAVPRPAQLHEQPAALRLHRGRTSPTAAPTG